MLLRYDPFRELDRLAEQLWGSTPAAAPARRVPMDAFRRGDVVTVSFDLPGVDPASIDITVEDNSLTLKAERRPAAPEGAEALVCERAFGSFTRQLFLGENLDTSKIEATYRDGVLTLSIPVAEQAKPRKITVSAEGDARSIETTAQES